MPRGGIAAAATAICGVFYDKLGLKFQTYDQWDRVGRSCPGRHTS